MSDPLQSLLGPVFQALRQVTPDFLARQNVVACGVGYKIKGQEPTTTPSVVVSVSHKVPPSSLSAADLIPKAINNVPTDVVETGEIVAFGVNRTVVMRPVRPGVSVGNLQGPTGTVGCIVQRGGQRFLLSNNHVLAMLNRAPVGDPVIQPGPADGGTATDQVASLTQFVPITFMDAAPAVSAAGTSAQSTQPQGCAVMLSQIFQTLLNSLASARRPTTALPPPPLAQIGNLVDAAIAGPLDDSWLDPNIIDIGAPPQGVIQPALGMKVFKSGRTSALTEGTISQVDVTVDVKYDERVARFTNQIMITPLSQPGDSGSLILDFQRNAVGLLFSGSDLVTVANPIASVLAALNVQLVTAASSVTAPPPDFG